MRRRCLYCKHAPDTILVCAALNKVIPNPVERPSSWVSAAYPSDSEDPAAAMCSAAYQVRTPNHVTFAAHINVMGLMTEAFRASQAYDVSAVGLSRSERLNVH